LTPDQAIANHSVSTRTYAQAFFTVLFVTSHASLDFSRHSYRLFDSSEPDVRSSTFLLNQLARASDAGVPTVLIRGNHDALLDHTARGKLGDHIYLLDKKQPTVHIKNIAFHGLSFDKNHQEQSMLPRYPEP